MCGFGEQLLPQQTRKRVWKHLKKCSNKHTNLSQLLLDHHNMAVLAILFLVCASLVAFITGDHITSSDPVFNEHAVWISLGDRAYTCADACHMLGGSCDATQYTLLTRKLFISKILPYAVSVEKCAGYPDGVWKFAGVTLDYVKHNCELLTANVVARVKVQDDDDDSNTDDDYDDDDQVMNQYFNLHTKQSCYLRGDFDDNDGGYENSGDRVLCPCIYDSTHTPTETPTKAPSPVPNTVPTPRPTLNHPALEMEKKFAKIQKQLEKERNKDEKA